MQLHTLKKTNKTQSARRVGRGGKRGSFSGRGIKGQKARSGRRIRPEVRDLIKKIPKRRGYSRKRSFPPKFRASIKASIIKKHFKSGEVVSPRALVERGLVHKIKGKIPEVKILEPGKFLDGLVIKDCKVSARV